MSWTVIQGGVENKMSSCGCSQLPAGQGALPPTVQPTLCQGLLPAAVQAAGTPKLLGPPPSPLGPSARLSRGRGAAHAACLRTSKAPFPETLNFWKSRDRVVGFVFVFNLALALGFSGHLDTPFLCG